MDRRNFLQRSAALAALPLIPSLANAGARGAAKTSGLSSQTITVNGDRLNGWLAAFDRIGRTPTGINRVAYSEGDLAGRAFTLDLFKQSGLSPVIDAAGNIVARVPGSNPALKPIVIGSHVDSVTDGGNFDGPVGSFGAIEVARTLAERRMQLAHPLDVVVWQNEEGGTYGSRLWAGLYSEADLDKVARSGKTIREGIGLIGGDVAKLASVRRKEGDVACYLELHIEQGGLLEKASKKIGVVQGIVGLRWFEITITGFSNHAGATPMDQRQDAMLAAARFTVAVNDAIRRVPGRQVATVGRVNVTPNTTNVIPGQVVLTVDLRDIEQATIERFTQQFEQLGREIGEATGTQFKFARLTDSKPALADPRVMDWVQQSADTLKFTHQRMPSGAGHDAQEMSHLGPMGMIFVPSVGGISHSPREFSHAADITNGANVLLHAVIAADKSLR
ncbi:MAG: M20 family metallo-hydrolase [Gemmatimonadaceae bacterium]|nr:M20 family metallo-hydrolase [Gemmatimonadaceae bacterium]